MSQPGQNDSNDSFLLQQVEEGSQQAFNALFEKYWEKAYSDAYKRLKNEDDAKDVVQKIFTQIWVNRQGQKIQNLPAYLHVAIRNSVLKLMAQKKHFHPFFQVPDNVPETNSRADTILLRKEFFNSYEAVLQSLPPKRQLIFRLRYQEDLSTKDISRRLGITRKTVQNQLARAIESLKVSFLHILESCIFLFLLFS